ncbi:hypothetical protein [Mucilaginibacter auburnensis]|uniref:Uncharacterized protein n=1 Tax=Mucilaginibacter auburnensis TaxID=1457233 RepID=A0A2H9VMZ9_9SPHI|nr:hypothetical protein [Mucilaginibacter auburnensis]PJJ79695.1 hypothetical protein CLV57_2832 [Mucilaginibacter auburnensis]
MDNATYLEIQQKSKKRFPLLIGIVILLVAGMYWLVPVGVYHSMGNVLIVPVCLAICILSVFAASYALNAINPAKGPSNSAGFIAFAVIVISLLGVRACLFSDP